MRYILLLATFLPLSLYAQMDTLRVDTLQEVLVMPNYTVPDMIDPMLKESATIGSKTHLLPEGFHDRVMHPFAIKDRKQERHRKKMKKILEQYDLIKTFDEEVIEALKREGLYDELMEELEAQQKKAE